MHTTDMHISGYVLGRLAALVMLLALSVSSTAAERIALVIGNDTYKDEPLNNAVNDAASISRKLESLGFKVDTLKNAKLKEMRIALKKFSRLAKQKPATDAVLFFAGHGIQSEGVNYLLPVDAERGSEAAAAGSSAAVSSSAS